MKTKCLMLALFITAISFAQNTKRPGELIEKAKASGTTFKEVGLFTSTKDKKIKEKIPKELRKYTVFEMENQKYKAFETEKLSSINLKIPFQNSEMTLELIKVEILSDDFEVIQANSGKVLKQKSNILHYRGRIKGATRSLAAISFYDGQLSGIISAPEKGANIVIGKLGKSNQMIAYEDKEINHLREFECQSRISDTFSGYTEEELFSTKNTKASSQCVKVFFDVNSDIIQDKGGEQGASNYLQSLFNQVATLYANDGMTIKLSGFKMWTSGTDFSDSLDSYTSYRNQNNFNGNLAHYVTYARNGGIAWLSGLCSSYNTGISGINGSFSNVPTFSWDVEVLAHELGHNMGSNHTHDCVWNGNNTAIDGCYSVSGGCDDPGLPSGGGTIMSYCHLTSAGIDFSKGFGAQPSNVMRNHIASSSNCLTSCSTGGGCSTGDSITATFTNNSDCPLKYSVNNSYQFTADVGASVQSSTIVGDNWSVTDTSDQAVDSFQISCNQTTYTTSVVCNSTGGCSVGDTVTATFANNSDCPLKYSLNSSYQFTVDTGASLQSEAIVGDKWSVTDTSDQEVDNFQITCNQSTYTTKVVCTSSGGDPCHGISEWSSNSSYSVGDKATYQGSLYQLTENGWVKIDVCGGNSNNPCHNVADWNSGTNYQNGDRMVYQGNLYQYNSGRWEYVTSCNQATANLVSESLNFDFRVYPNPVKDKLNIRMNRSLVEQGFIMVKDIHGNKRILKNVNINPQNGKNEIGIDMSSLEAGIYFIQFVNSHRKITRKVFKR
ncbi:M12 family metallo-peptidase [Aquimarina sediminis]|uniref:M12 family metallo-peptidase n=1 Tax=Aquimarina sediminis TaxID=2070536 RepID=UPI000CA03D08|nr:M12 family metallo-peptidase [Aquimarina sediminis]